MAGARSKGFTLVELGVVLAVVGILAAIALPNLRDFVARMRIKTATGDLHMALLYARTEAIKRNSDITVSPLGGGTDWSVGWETKAGTTVLSRQNPFSGISFSTRDAAYTAATLSSITFGGQGRETGSAGAGVAFVLSVPDFPRVAARCVVLDPSGRAAVRQDANNDPADGCNS